MAKKLPLPVDPLESPHYGLHGTIVTMQDADTFFKGTLYITAARIAAIVPDGKMVPVHLRNYPVYKTRGTLFPGLIELHNHLSYNCLPMWNVPKQFGNRSQWSGIPEYQKNISHPMNILGKTPGYVQAIVRYVECKCLAGGVTTSQGIMLFSNAGIKKYYKGIVRNVEQTNDPALPAVDAHIPDIVARDAQKFSNQLKKSSCMLLHLSEGRDASAHKHFEALKINSHEWAIAPSLAGIHCVALNAADYNIMQQKGASMIWSPFSNLLLYGQTADIKSARQSGITIALGSDWSPSGSKNLLGELKVAKIYSADNGNIFTDFELVAMATKNAARIIKWDKELGTLEKGKRADLLIINGQSANPYDLLFKASEKSIALVVINGKPRYGDKALMNHFRFESPAEKRTIGRKTKLFNLSQATQDVAVGDVSLSKAERLLKNGLANIKKLATQLTEGLQPVHGATGSRFLFPRKQTTVEQEWYLLLDHDEAEGEPQRPHLEINGQPTMPMRATSTAIRPETLSPIELDALTVASDKHFFQKIAAQKNLPQVIKTKLRDYYADL